MKKGLFVFLVKNSSHLQVETDTLPPTSKENSKEHGMGLKSIKEIVERYHGMLEIRTEEGMFEVFLYPPVETR
ncbi:MAG: GHKL domain-containing protein [Cellulosilyticum sp.]|nr:GHKL domain-containing protein [Cellulosilyticum sp.]